MHNAQFIIKNLRARNGDFFGLEVLVFYVKDCKDFAILRRFGQKNFAILRIFGWKDFAIFDKNGKKDFAIFDKQIIFAL